MLQEQQIEFDLEVQNGETAAFSTIAGQAFGNARYIRQAGCPDQFGVVQLIIEPYRGRSHFLLDWRVAEDIIPSLFMPAVIEGIQHAAGHAERGPIVGIKVSVVDGMFHPIDSRSHSFTIATMLAFKAALQDTEVIPLHLTFSHTSATPSETPDTTATVSET